MKVSADLIKKIAFKSGFDSCGITSATHLQKDIEFFLNWLSAEKNAGMQYMENNLNLRENPKELFENAKTVISVLLSYNVPNTPKLDYYISKYARGQDYHKVIKPRLKALVENIKEVYPEVNARVFTDSAPVLERSFARNAGLGFIGKNTCLINPKFGSFVFIGEIICDAECDYDTKLDIDCKDCNICIKSCPTGALSKSGLNANRCISYHTIENKDEIPPDIAKRITNQVFGCDICQDVCPYNKDIPFTRHKEFQINPKMTSLSIEMLENITNSKFSRTFADTPLNRTRRTKLLSNFKILENKKNRCCGDM